MRFWGDIADKEWFRSRAARSPSVLDPRSSSRDEMVCARAKEIYDGLADGSDESRFVSLAKAFLGKGTAENQYSSLDQFSVLFNLDFPNLRAWLKWKGVIQTVRKPSEKE